MQRTVESQRHSTILSAPQRQLRDRSPISLQPRILRTSGRASVRRGIRDAGLKFSQNAVRRMEQMTDEVKNEIRQLTRIQRRVVGVLMEKAFTTPEQYPLTLKATTTGCNQKNNRDPLSEYTEDQVADALEQLRQLGLVAEVFTDGGRAARYRHYMRHKFDFNEAQFAIIAELLLRGRQQPGELRTRVSRMAKIESQDQLKLELQALQEKGFVQANGPLERRGVDVDHTFYLPKEGHVLEPASLIPDAQVPVSAEPPRAAMPPSGAHDVVPNRVASTAAPQADGLRVLAEQVRDLTEQVRSLTAATESLEQRLHRIERDLGI